MIALILASVYVFHWRPFGYIFFDVGYLALLVGLFLPLAFIWLPATKKSPRDRLPWYDVILVILSAGIPGYLFYHQSDIMLKGWALGAPPMAVTLGFLLWMIVLEAGRRAAGPIFLVLTAVISFYPLFGSYLPGFLASPKFSFALVVSYLTMSEESLLGLVIRVFGKLFFGYMLFAIVFQMLGAGKFFTDVAIALVGKTRAGNAKVAIFASALFGSISGDVLSNVFITGTFTIPAMKKEGMPPHYAAAVEACASSGGVLMPPIMGAVAFLMAEFLEVSYATVALVAAVPAILYYICLFAQIDAYAARVGLKPKPITVEVPPIRRTLVNNLHLILGFLFLIFLVFYYRLVVQGPWIATLATIVLSVFRKETRQHLNRLAVGVWDELGRILGEMMSLLAPIGMILGGFILTGLAFSLPSVIVRMAGDNVALILVLGAAAAFILGMGVPVSACYIFLAIVLAPSLVTFGFDLLASHLYVLYWATISYITPPVALAAMAAATIAGADPVKTGFQAMRLGVVKYIVPFIFILNPALILRAPVTEIILAIPTATLGVVVLSGSMEGYFWGVGKLTIVTRIILFGAGILTVIPGWVTDAYGAATVVALIGLARLLRRKNSFYKILVHQSQPITQNGRNEHQINN